MALLGTPIEVYKVFAAVKKKKGVRWEYPFNVKVLCPYTFNRCQQTLDRPIAITLGLAMCAYVLNGEKGRKPLPDTSGAANFQGKQKDQRLKLNMPNSSLTHHHPLREVRRPLYT